MTAALIFLPLIAIVGATGQLLPAAAARRRQPSTLPAWSPWFRAITGWVCVCLGVVMGLLVAQVTAIPAVPIACVFLTIVGIMQALWARDATRHLQ